LKIFGKEAQILGPQKGREYCWKVIHLLNARYMARTYSYIYPYRYKYICIYRFNFPCKRRTEKKFRTALDEKVTLCFLGHNGEGEERLSFCRVDQRGGAGEGGRGRGWEMWTYTICSYIHLYSRTIQWGYRGDAIFQNLGGGVWGCVGGGGGGFLWVY
jgi:hypothetical protein